MSGKTHNAIEFLNRADQALEAADKKKTFGNGLTVAKEVMALLGIEDAQVELKSFPRIKANPGWTKNAPDYEDRKASYVLAENNDRNIDFKLYWVTKPTKRVVSNLVALTPNFEDEPFYSNKNIGIDFILTEKADRLIIALSNNYKIRSLEIHKRLSNTQKKIFEKWAQEFDFSNKAQVHKVLWDSFDIQPLNKEFYVEISGFFNDLVQHLEKKEILDIKHRSQFVNRLIGRIIFCWFLRKKEIIAEDYGYFNADEKPATEYYASKLETLFFKVLNTPLEERGFGIDDKTPFLNGGLFEPKNNDFYGLQTLSFPADYFERFYEFLNHYNFTTDESTSDYQQVAIDPEMLGRIFENLLAEEVGETGEQARKAKGAFYTPREIVEYMCRESLRAYVSEKLGNDARKGDVLQLLFDKKEHELDLKNSWGSLGAYKNKIIEALDEIKIIDPACGSGAFPIGMLQIMLSIYERLDTRLDHYKTKLGIIKNNIFGVDIEPMAVEISRLRTWLSLVVDSTIKPSEKNKGIEELPNLDFKFVCANSLITLSQEEGLFDNKEMAEQMQAIRERYFKTGSLRIKEKMKKDYEIILQKNQSMFVSEKQKQLLSYHPFDSDNVCSFFNSQFMFGTTNFDIVIANPPYVFARNSAQKGLTEKDKKYFYENYELAEYQVNLYPLFIERSVRMLRPDGYLTFITPNNWLTINTNQSLRRFVLQKSNITLVNFYARVFESAAVDSAVIFFTNGQSHPVVRLYEFTDNLHFIKEADCSYFLNRKGHVINIEAFKTGGVAELLLRIEDCSQTLDLLSDVKAGLVAYEVGKGTPPQSREMKEKRVYHATKKIGKDYYKYLDGRDVCRYFIGWSGEYLKYGENLAAPRTDFSLYSTERILVRQIPAKPPYCIHACIVEDTILNDRNSMNVINMKESPELLLGIINSRLISFWFVHKFGKLQRGTFPQFKVNELAIFPIARNGGLYKKDIVGLVRQIMKMKESDPAAKTEKQDKEIDEMVYKMYDLTSKEIALVEACK
jgi:hypothetical protein